MNGKKKGKMMLAGSFTFAGPDIVERLARGEEVVFEEDHNEVHLKIIRAEKYSAVSFSPLVWAEAANVKITNDAIEQGGNLGEDFAIFIEGEGDRSVSFSISVAQAEALVQVLQNFIAVDRALDELEKTREVAAA